MVIATTALSTKGNKISKNKTNRNKNLPRQTLAVFVSETNFKSDPSNTNTKIYIKRTLKR